MAPSLFSHLHRHNRSPTETCHGATAAGSRCINPIQASLEALLSDLKKAPAKAGPVLEAELHSICGKLFCAAHVDQAGPMVQSWMGTSEGTGLEQDEEQAHEAAVKLREGLRDGKEKERRRSRFVELLGAEDEEAALQRFPDAFEYEALEAAALGEVAFGAHIIRAADEPVLQRRATIGSGDEADTGANDPLKRGGENRRRTFPTSARERLARNTMLEERVRRSMEEDDEYQVALEQIGRLVEYEEPFVDVDEETSLLDEEDKDGDLMLVRVQKVGEDSKLKKVWSRTEREGRGRYRESRMRSWCRSLRSFFGR